MVFTTTTTTSSTAPLWHGDGTRLGNCQKCTSYNSSTTISHTAHTSATQLPPHAQLCPMPFCISPEPNDMVYAASAAKMETHLRDTVIEFIQKDREGKNEVFQQVYISPSPYYDAFTKRLDLRRWHPNDHPTAGLRLIQDDGRVIIAAMEPSTPASRIPCWRTQIKGAWLMQVGNTRILTLEDVKQAIKCQKAEGHLYCELLLAHPELRDGQTQEGIPINSTQGTLAITSSSQLNKYHL